MALDYEAVIGLEVHVQLLTRTKIFCGCSTTPGEPNSRVCPVCLGLPGALPVLNRQALEFAIRAGLALGCTIRARSQFARKNYFYADLPKGYQISQYDEPLCEHGYLDVPLSDGGKRRVGIQRIHMEEDAGKNLHGTHNQRDSLVDLNRAGIPLVEIVSAPDVRSGAEAAEYLRQLRGVVMALGINDGDLEKGSFRCDANVSVRPRGSTVLGTRVEIKNVNSFRFVQKAIEYEVAEQISKCAAGVKVQQWTKQWNEAEGRTLPLREKGDADDYRYFPDPDLPPLGVSEAALTALRAALPELPAAQRATLVEAHQLPFGTALVLTEHPRLVELYLQTCAAVPEVDRARVANFLINEVKRDLVYDGLSMAFSAGLHPQTPEALGQILALVHKGVLSSSLAKDVYGAALQTGETPEKIVSDRGLAVVSDGAAIEAVCKKVLADNARQAEAYKQGKTGLFGFLVGQVMKAMGGKASPALVNETLKRLLG